MGENVQFFITENRNREPNNRGISNRDRNFKNRNRKFNSGLISSFPLLTYLLAFTYLVKFLTAPSSHASHLCVKVLDKVLVSAISLKNLLLAKCEKVRKLEKELIRLNMEIYML